MNQMIAIIFVSWEKVQPYSLQSATMPIISPIMCTGYVINNICHSSIIATVTVNVVATLQMDHA